MIESIDGLRIPATASGPAQGRVVVMFNASPSEADRVVIDRLNFAMLRTIVLPPDRRLGTKAIVNILDRLGAPTGLLVGDQIGAEIAWKVAADHGERITGLVVIDRGHPRVPDRGIVRDPECPPVHADTTVLVSNGRAHSVARASRKHVRGDFRITELAGTRTSRHYVTQLTTEIVLRSHTW